MAEKEAPQVPEFNFDFKGKQYTLPAFNKLPFRTSKVLKDFTSSVDNKSKLDDEIAVNFAYDLILTLEKADSSLTPFVDTANIEEVGEVIRQWFEFVAEKSDLEPKN